MSKYLLKWVSITHSCLWNWNVKRSKRSSSELLIKESLLMNEMRVNAIFSAFLRKKCSLRCRWVTSRLMDESFLSTVWCRHVGSSITNWNPTTGTVFVWYELFTYLRRIRMSSMTHNSEMLVTFFSDDSNLSKEKLFGLFYFPRILSMLCEISCLISGLFNLFLRFLRL